MKRSTSLFHVAADVIVLFSYLQTVTQMIPVTHQLRKVFDFSPTVSLISLLSTHLSLLPLSRPVEEPNSGVEKVANWQNSMYLDSGIQSRATTIRGDDGDRQYTMTTSTITTEEPRESPRLALRLYFSFTPVFSTLTCRSLLPPLYQMLRLPPELSGSVPPCSRRRSRVALRSCPCRRTRRR